MIKIDLPGLIESYCEKETERAAYLVSEKIYEVLLPFFDFIQKKKIDITQPENLSNIDLFNYYSILKDQTNHNNAEIVRHIKILFKFLKYIELFSREKELNLYEETNSS